MAKLNHQNESGQAIVEYILIMAVVVGIFVVVSQGIGRMNLANSLMAPLNKEFANTYKYGHPLAQGWDEGTPYYHPRITDKDNFRIFINPGESTADGF